MVGAGALKMILGPEINEAPRAVVAILLKMIFHRD